MTAGRRAAETLPVGFFERPVRQVARDLLGRLLVSEAGGVRTAGRIVETEAYLGRTDPASHAYRSRRHAHNQALYGPPGTWYVYLSYGVHWCANLVAGIPDAGGAVLLRALQPVDGIPRMRRRRRREPVRDLCSGPGKLCQALGITRRLLDGRLMPDTRVYVVEEGLPARRAVQVTPRVGITRAADWPLRFVLRGSEWASRQPGGERRMPAADGE